MASERNNAKSAILERGRDDPELDETLTSAHAYQLELAKEKNRHAERMRARDLGFFGKLAGGERVSPIFVAFLAMIAGLAGAVYCWTHAGADSQIADFWGKQAERAIGFATAAMTFILGRATANK